MNQKRIVIILTHILLALEFLCPIFAVAYFMHNFHLIAPASLPKLGETFRVGFISFLLFLTIPELVSCLTTRASRKKGQPTSAIYHVFGCILGLLLLRDYCLSRSTVFSFAMLLSLYLNYGIRMLGVCLIKRRLRILSLCKNCAMDKVPGKAVCPFCGEPY